MQIRKRLFLSNFMMFLVPFCTIVLIAGAFYISYQGMKLSGMGNLTSDKQVIHQVEDDLRTTLGQQSGAEATADWQAELEDLAARMDAVRYHLLVLDEQRRTVFSTCTPLDEQLLGEELEPVAFESDSAVYIFRSSNIVKYMFLHDGQQYHAIGILSRDISSIEGRLCYIYHSYTGLLILTGMLILFLVNFYLAHRLSQKIIRPLEALQAGARAIERGDLSVRIQTDSDEEFQELCRHFNAMTIRLEDSRRERETYENDRRMLLAGISHDLRTPLTVIKGYIEGLRDGVADTPEMQQHYVAKIHERTLQIDTLVDRLFLYSKMNLGEYPFHFQPTVIGSWLRSVIATWQAAEPAGEQILLDLPAEADQTVIQLDTVEMKRVLDNLCNNARKYHGQKLLILSVRLELRPNEIVLKVADNGPGVAESELPRLFLEFYRGDLARTATTKGSGLGLSIAAQIVHAHHGEIWAENHDGLTVVMVVPKEVQRG